MDKMKNFKGLFHDQNIETPNYEGGAHFKYSDLINKLNSIIRHLSPRRLSNKSSANDSSNDEILDDRKRHNFRKHISKSKKKQKPNNRNKESEFLLPKINTNNLNNLKNIIDVKNDNINNLITKDTESNVEKTILPKIITKSNDSLNKKTKKTHHQKVINEENYLLKSEDLNKKRRESRRKRVITEENYLLKSEDLNKKRRKIRQNRVITEENDLLKSEDFNKKRKKKFIQEEQTKVDFEDKEINEPLTIKHNRKRNCENGADILDRISELKKKLLGLDNKDKIIRLKPSIKIE